MKKAGYLSSFLRNLFIVVAAILIAVTTVYATTTIGSNILTAGTLTASGDTSLAAATTTHTLYVTSYASSTGGLFTQGNLHAGGTASFDGKTTSTIALAVGAGTINKLDMAGGDLYVKDSVEIDSDLFVTNKATSTVALAVGAGTIDSLDMAGGDLYVLDDGEFDGDLVVSGGTIDLATTSATTTPGIFSRDATNVIGAATSTISVGNISASPAAKGCLEMVSTDGVYYSCFVDNLHATATSSGYFLLCHLSRCK